MLIGGISLSIMFVDTSAKSAVTLLLAAIYRKIRTEAEIPLTKCSLEQQMHEAGWYGTEN